MRDAIEDSQQQTDGGPVTLLAHSAGGWLARVYLLSFGTEGGRFIQGCCIGTGSGTWASVVRKVARSRGIRHLLLGLLAQVKRRHPRRRSTVVSNRLLAGSGPRPRAASGWEHQ